MITKAKLVVTITTKVVTITIANSIVPITMNAVTDTYHVC